MQMFKLVREMLHLFQVISMYVLYRDLEANQFSGQVPPEIGKLVNLRTL